MDRVNFRAYNKTLTGGLKSIVEIISINPYVYLLYFTMVSKYLNHHTILMHIKLCFLHSPV